MIILSNIHKLYDGTSGTAKAIHERMDVWIDGGMIKAVHPHHPTQPHGSEVQRVDCLAYTVTPGLIDCHGHVTLWGVGNENLDRMNSPEAPFWAERILYRTLVHGGVTTLRDVGGATHVLKRLVDQGVYVRRPEHACWSERHRSPPEASLTTGRALSARGARKTPGPPR